jgi:hypothetical protein
MGFQGFANLQRISKPYEYEEVCEHKTGFATKKKARIKPR